VARVLAVLNMSISVSRGTRRRFVRREQQRNWSLLVGRGKRVFCSPNSTEQIGAHTSSQPCGVEVYCDWKLKLTRYLPVVSRSRMR
jgi:hypothetical protein